MKSYKLLLAVLIAVVVAAFTVQLVSAPYHQPPNQPLTVERGKITEFQEEVASSVIKPGECFTVVKEDKERFESSERDRRGWIRITEIIKDIDICNDNGEIKRSYHEHVIVCEKSPDLQQVTCNDYHAHEPQP